MINMSVLKTGSVVLCAGHLRETSKFIPEHS